MRSNKQIGVNVSKQGLPYKRIKAKHYKGDLTHNKTLWLDIFISYIKFQKGFKLVLF